MYQLNWLTSIDQLKISLPLSIPQHIKAWLNLFSDFFSTSSFSFFSARSFFPSSLIIFFNVPGMSLKTTVHRVLSSGKSQIIELSYSSKLMPASKSKVSSLMGNFQLIDPDLLSKYEWKYLSAYCKPFLRWYSCNLLHILWANWKLLVRWCPTSHKLSFTVWRSY